METSTKNISLLSWLLIPILAAIFSASYFINMVSRTSAQIPHTPIIKSLAKKEVDIPKVKPFTYQNTGLVTFWFDDGWDSQYNEAFPILEEAGYKGAVAVPTRLISYDQYMTWPQLKRMQLFGWEMTAHTRTHRCDLDKATRSELEFEVVGAIEDSKNQKIQYDNFVTPCGVESEQYKNLVKKHFKSLRTSDEGLNQIPVEDPYHIMSYAVNNMTTPSEVREWVDKAKAEKAWLIIMFHQIDHSNNLYATTPFMLSEYVGIVKQSGLPVVLPTQALNIKETKK